MQFKVEVYCENTLSTSFQETIPLKVASPKPRSFTQYKGDCTLCVFLGTSISVFLVLEVIQSLSCRGVFAEYKYELSRDHFADCQSCMAWIKSSTRSLWMLAWPTTCMYLRTKLPNICVGDLSWLKAFFTISISNLSLSALIHDRVRCLVKWFLMWRGDWY